MNSATGQLQNRLLRMVRLQWAMLGVVFAVAGLFYLLGIRPATARLTELHQRASAQRTQLQVNRDRARDLPRVEQEIAWLRQRVERFDKKLPRQQDLAQFINDVTEIGQQTSLRKLIWHPDAKPRRTDQFDELPIQLSFEGDFRGVFDFLRRTEDMQRLTRVHRMEIRTKDAKTGQVEVQLTMDIYFAEE